MGKQTSIIHSEGLETSQFFIIVIRILFMKLHDKFPYNFINIVCVLNRKRQGERFKTRKIDFFILLVNAVFNTAIYDYRKN